MPAFHTMTPDEIKRVAEQMSRDQQPALWGKIDVLTAQLAATQLAIPDGWQLVPVEPTEEMVMEGCRSIHCPVLGTDEPYYAYRAMIAAAPEPSK